MQEFRFKQVEDETFCLMAYQGDEKEVFIPNTHYGQPVTIIFDGVFRFHPEIESIHIPKTVTDLGEFVFEGCDNLRHIKLPEGLKDMWGNTFARRGIEEITIPGSVMSLASGTFTDCKNLKKVVCRSGMKKIRAWAFAGCNQLKEFIHDSDVEISAEAFTRREDSSLRK
ncbi:MAG: leucine-rich repeat domain-containing protein [Clostridia bacterium]|nr:leucine-rich repeat domain-containing protein [Clostridia bacterium]